MKNLCKVKATMLNVILFGIITGVYTGLIMLVPFLKNTSFQDIGISYEWWVIFAIAIVLKCNKWYEAGIKCFVFFLVSQPLVYVVEVLFGGLSISLALNYYLHIWLPATFLTLIGGVIAYFCKKQNLIGDIVLAIGLSLQTLLFIYYTITTILNFPYHIISAVVCLASIVVLITVIKKSKKHRIITFASMLIITAAVIIIIKCMGLYLVSNVF